MLKKTLPSTLQLFKAETTFITQPKHPELSHSQALHTLSKEYGYASWHNVKPLLEDYPCKEDWNKNGLSLSRKKECKILAKTVQTKIGVAGYLYYYPETEEIESVVEIYSAGMVGRKVYEQTEKLLSKTNKEIKSFWNKEYRLMVAEEIQKYFLRRREEYETTNNEESTHTHQTEETLLFSVVSMDEEDGTDINKTERLYLLDDGEYKLEGGFGTFTTNDENTDFLDLLFYLTHCIDATTRFNMKNVFFLNEKFPEILKKEEEQYFSSKQEDDEYQKNIFNVINIYIQHKDKLFMENMTNTETKELLFDSKEIINNEGFQIREVSALLYDELSPPRKKIVLTYQSTDYRSFFYEMAYKNIENELSVKNIDKFIEEVVATELSEEIKVLSVLLKADEEQIERMSKELGYEDPDFLMEKIHFYLDGDMKKELIEYIEKKK